MLLYNAVIWTMDGEDIPEGYVRIRDGRIDSLGGMSERPLADAGEDVMNLSGRLLLPGFVDAHSHIGLHSTALGAEGDDVNEDTEPLSPHLRALDGIDPFDDAFRQARAAGVTCAVVSPGSANPIAGQICALKTAGRCVDAMAVAEPLAVKFALGENPKMVYGAKPQFPVTRMGTAALIREQLAEARRYLEDVRRAGEDEDFDMPEYDAKCEALLPLLRGEIAAHIHAHKAYDIMTGIRIAEEYGLRCTIVHGTEAYLVADILAEKRVHVICGPMLCARTKPELAGQSADNCRRLADAGVCVAICTDYPELPQELLMLSAAVAEAGGLGSRAALRAITIDAARAAGLEARVGSITPGKDADLLVFSGDLSRVGARPDMVCIGGEWVHSTAEK